MHAKLINPKTGMKKDVKVGYSWTMFFFGFWVAIFRNDYKGAILSLLGDICTGTLFSTVYGFFYNKQYTQQLIETGYLPTDDLNKKILLNKDYISDLTPVAEQPQPKPDSEN